MKKLKAMNSIDMKSRMTVASASNRLNLIKHQTTDATQCDRLMSEAEALPCTNGVVHLIEPMRVSLICSVTSAVYFGCVN